MEKWIIVEIMPGGTKLNVRVDSVVAFREVTAAPTVPLGAKTLIVLIGGMALYIKDELSALKGKLGLAIGKPPTEVV